MVAALAFCIMSYAGPAPTGPVAYTQPDGSVVMITMHGDEWCHWATDASGRVVALGDDGYWHPAEKPASEVIAKGSEQRENANMRRVRKAASHNNTGTRRFLVLLVEFSDKYFRSSTANADFSALLNQDNYSANGCIGSVKEYFYENSMGVFTPIFDVVGPIRLDKSYTYYGANGTNGKDTHPELALADALKKLSSSLDLSPYDSDGDHVLDAVLFYYAGNNEAEGGGTNTIWPHEWYLSYSSYVTTADRYVNGYYVDCYSCTSELRMAGTTMCGIGTACHEFGHALGLPDFYDTDDTDNGSCDGCLYTYSTMCSGSYNSDGCIPPYFTAEERLILGWMDSITMMPSSGTVTIPALSTNFAYKTNSNVSNEYFVYECRSGQRWDAPLPTGMVVYHVDKSSNIVSGSTRASSLWNGGNKINAYGSHPCCYIVPANNQTSLAYPQTELETSSGTKYLPFPGRGNKITYTPKFWSGASADYSFTGIAYNSSSRTVTMNISSNSRLLTGRVKTTKNAGIPGASVKVYSAAEAVSQTGRLYSRALASGNVVAEATTDDSGTYIIDMASVSGSSFDVEVSAEGYNSTTASVQVGSGVNEQDFVLVSDSAVEDSYLFKYNAENDLTIIGMGYGFGMMGAVGFTADEMLGNVGRRVDAISFMYFEEVNDGVYVVIDFGTTRKLWLKVDNPVSGAYMTIDLREYNIVIPEGQACYFGYAVDNPTGVGYPLVYETGDHQEGGFYYAALNESSSTWYEFEEGNIIVDVTLSPSVPYNYIVDPKNGVYQVGDSFVLDLVEASNYRAPYSISWYFDDEPVSGNTIPLDTPGDHTVTAEITMANGYKKIVELEISVE